MASVTGLTAERMLAIEAASVVDGDVVNGELILTKHDGSQINAGSVIGPTGPPTVTNITDPGGTAPPSAFGTTAITFVSVGALANGWPLTYSTVTTFRLQGSRGYQMLVKKISGETWIRAEADGDTWGEWRSQDEHLATIDGRLENLEAGGAWLYGSNRDVNGDWSAADLGWGAFWGADTLSYYLDSPGIGYSGDFALRTVASALNGYRRYYQNDAAPCVPGETLEIVVWARRENTQAAKVYNHFIFGATATQANFFQSGAISHDGGAVTPTSGSGWTQVVYRTTVPTGMYYYRSMTSVTEMASGASVLLSNRSTRRIEAPPLNTTVVPHIIARRGTDQLIPSGSWTAVGFPTVVEYRGGFSSVRSPNTDFVVPLSGVYILRSVIRMSTNQAGTRYLEWIKNGLGVAGRSNTIGERSDATELEHVVTSYAAAGDVFKLQAYQSSGTTLTIEAPNAQATSFASVTWIGP